MREWRRGDGRGREDWRREDPERRRYGTDHRDVFQREREESVRGVEVVSDARAGRGKREIFIGRKWKPHKMPVLAVSVDSEWAVFGDGEGQTNDSGLGHRQRVRDALVQRSYGYGDCGAISRDERGFEAVFWFGLRRGWILGICEEQAGRAPMAKDAHVSAVTAIGISTCGKKILSAGRDGVVRVFGLNGKVISTTNVGEAVEAARVLPRKSALYGKSGEDREEDGKVRFATVGSGGKVKLWKEGAGKARFWNRKR